MSALGSIAPARLRRWRAPLFARREHSDSLDDAAQALEQLARSVAACAPRVLGSVSKASRGPVERRGYVDTPDVADRAWRLSYSGREIFCVLDDLSQRVLLRFIIGAAPAHDVTAIERSIVGELVGRLVAAAQAGGDPSPPVSHGPKEELRARPPAQAWRCNVEVCDEAKARAMLQLFIECLPPPSPSLSRPSLQDVPLRLAAGFFGIGCGLAEIVQWRPGTLLGLRRPHSDATVQLLVGNRRLATAHVGALYGERALKLLTVDANRP